VVKHTLLKKRELLAKDQLSQCAFTLLCPLASRLTLGLHSVMLFPRTVNNPG